MRELLDACDDADCVARKGGERGARLHAAMGRRSIMPPACEGHAECLQTKWGFTMGRLGKKLAAAAARNKMANNAAAALEKQEREAQLSRTLLYHLMRKEGRVRISQADIAALKEDDTVDFEVDDEHGMILATYRVG